MSAVFLCGTAGVAASAGLYQQQGLPIQFISREQQLQHAAAGLVPEDLAAKLQAQTLQQDPQETHTSTCRVATAAAPTAAAASSSSSQSAQRAVQQLPIGDMRTLLQVHLAVVVQQLPSRCREAAVVWVLDEDKQLLRLPQGKNQQSLVMCYCSWQCTTSTSGGICGTYKAVTSMQVQRAALPAGDQHGMLWLQLLCRLIVAQRLPLFHSSYCKV